MNEMIPEFELLMIFAPRDIEELDVIKQITLRALDYVLGAAWARTRSLNEPWGLRSISSSPDPSVSLPLRMPSVKLSKYFATVSESARDLWAKTWIVGAINHSPRL